MEYPRLFLKHLNQKEAGGPELNPRHSAILGWVSCPWRSLSFSGILGLYYQIILSSIIAYLSLEIRCSEIETFKLTQCKLDRFSQITRPLWKQLWIQITIILNHSVGHSRKDFDLYSSGHCRNVSRKRAHLTGGGRGRPVIMACIRLSIVTLFTFVTSISSQRIAVQSTGLGKRVGYNKGSFPYIFHCWAEEYRSLHRPSLYRGSLCWGSTVTCYGCESVKLQPQENVLKPLLLPLKQ